MSKHNVSPTVRVEGWPVFQTLVLYEDLAAGRRATDTCNFLMARLGNELELRCSMWKFEVLQNAKFMQLAAAEATEADAIIVAAHGGASPLPAEISAWVEAWLPKRSAHPAALIALVDSAYQRGDTPAAAQDYLRSVAAAANMDFLTQVTAFPTNDFTGPSFPLKAERSATVLGDIPRWNSAERHWGINE